jgi:hypothetical protein
MRTDPSLDTINDFSVGDTKVFWGLVERERRRFTMNLNRHISDFERGGC